MAKEFIFPPSIQSDLFNYLNPEQQEFVKPILRVLKKPAQEELCCSLLDYMETGDVLPPDDLMLAAMFMYLTRQGLPENDDENDKRIIRPLSIKSSRCSMPKHISDIMSSIFPNFKKTSCVL